MISSNTAVATMTAMLCGADPIGGIDTGNLTTYAMAFERAKPIPRHVADLSLTSMVAAAHVNTPEAVVDHFARRFLSVPLPANDRATFVEFFRGKSVASESALRELLYLVLSTPEYQLS